MERARGLGLWWGTGEDADDDDDDNNDDNDDEGARGEEERGARAVARALARWWVGWVGVLCCAGLGWAGLGWACGRSRPAVKETGWGGRRNGNGNGNGNRNGNSEIEMRAGPTMAMGSSHAKPSSRRWNGMSDRCPLISCMSSHLVADDRRQRWKAPYHVYMYVCM